MHVIDKFIEAPGVLVACGGQKGALDFAFHRSTTDDDRDRWRRLFGSLCCALISVPEDEIKLILPYQTLVLRRSGDTYVGVAVKKGHPVVKSLQRMVRRAFKKMGSPVSPQGRPPLVTQTAPSARVLPDVHAARDPEGKDDIDNRGPRF